MNRWINHLNQWLNKLTPKSIIVLISLGAVLGALIAGLATKVATHIAEAETPFYRVGPLNDDMHDPKLWATNFPVHYELYAKTADMRRTRYGGSEALPWTPSQADPRSVVAQSKLQEDERLKKMWAGYGFALDFREDRGHAYMLTDQLFTLRQKVPQPGTCLNCHASTYGIYKKLGDGDIVEGFHKMNALPYKKVSKMAEHPVACIDCHKPADMSLRITRPAFIEGIRQVKALAGHSDYDVNQDATRQEMRTYVCAQCHVEYYFKGKEKTLTYPWSKGLSAENILAVYDEIGFKDWVHKQTGAPLLKAQHPEFELYSAGIHAQSGVTCSDCHMPYIRQGAYKISDHHVRSPYLNVSAACGTCHNIAPQKLRQRIDTIQARHWQLRNVAMDALMALIVDIATVRKSKGSPADADLQAKINSAQKYQRQAQFLLDFAEAENSTGFHAPQEAARILGNSIDLARKGQTALR